jgi:hypothetical protein
MESSVINQPEINHDINQPQRWPGRLIIMGFLLLAGVAVWMIVSQFGSTFFSPAVTNVAEMDQVTFTDETGLQLTLVAITAGGGMIELRYRVVDPDKAVIVHDEEKPPTIIKEKTGDELFLTMHVLDRNTNRAHDDDLHLGITYNTRIMNAGGLIKRGDRVTIRVGDTELKHVPVQ